MSLCLVVVICSISASFSPNDKYVLLSYLKKGLAVWCLEHDRIEQLEYDHHVVDQYICNSLFYNIGANYLLTGSENGKIVLYAIEGKNVFELSCCDEVVLCVDYSRTTGDIAAGTMGERNEVLVMKRRSLCVSCKAQEMD
ncbi:hypothetical protein JH06_0748 [Blastocystis sp. subtype 4]|uniref:hypothetical protein n=1 Tax=Blastocystis sp. subtype 4 TaxID=944170 RepID=UPI000711ECB6|nr:hypothetical protein JH06_0748 [Blastocystis sp. subtype 4]KNB45710.1 hypothetical protein JH06_0748 [Blastocystis sp. subtype 4]|eukprot:XP_014529153.1 hypothetical protein JH06_0748 [Blastocystis sp. subtype 4]